MNKKALIIPVAAMAVMATNAYAFNSDLLQEAGLSDDQIAAFEAAHDLRMEGNHFEARGVLEDAGVDQDTLSTIREAAYKHRAAIEETIANNDYAAFTDAVEGDGRLAEAITSEDDFAKLVEAHRLREAGDHESASKIFDELGLELESKGKRGGHHGAFLKRGDGSLGHSKGDCSSD